MDSFMKNQQGDLYSALGMQQQAQNQGRLVIHSYLLYNDIYYIYFLIFNIFYLIRTIFL